MQYRIRKLEEADLDTVAEFEVHIARQSFPDDPIEDPGFHRRKLARVVADDGAMVAVVHDTGAIAGWLHAATRKNFATEELYAELRSIYVAPEHRGTGLSGLLMRQLVSFARRAKAAKLQSRTGAGNAAMRRLFAGTGFKEKHIVFEMNLLDQ